MIIVDPASKQSTVCALSPALGTLPAVRQHTSRTRQSHRASGSEAERRREQSRYFLRDLSWVNNLSASPRKFE